MQRHLPVALLTLWLAAPAPAEPAPQLAQSVAARLAIHGIAVSPRSLSTPQAAALHLLMVSEGDVLDIRRRARAILRNPDFRDRGRRRD